MSMFDVGWVVVVRERNATFDHMWLQVGKLVIAERNSGARVNGKHENYNTSSDTLARELTPTRSHFYCVTG